MSVTSRTTIPCTPRRVTSASWWPDGICEVHATATGGGAAGPPGVGLGDPRRGHRRRWWLAAGGGHDSAALEGVLPRRTSRFHTNNRHLITAASHLWPP